MEMYREELILNLTSARELAATSLQASQARSKVRHDRSVRVREYYKGDWVLVKFPSEEMGRNRKLSQPWHGPYRVISTNEPDITVQKVYQTKPGQIQVHQSRVTPCPDDLPPGYYWYGRKHCCPGNPPRWVERLARQDRAPLSDSTLSVDPTSDDNSTSLPGQRIGDPGAHFPSGTADSTGTEPTAADHAGTDVETDCHHQTLCCGGNLQEWPQHRPDGYPLTDAASDSSESAQDPLDWSVPTRPRRDNPVEGETNVQPPNVQPMAIIGKQKACISSQTKTIKKYETKMMVVESKLTKLKVKLNRVSHRASYWRSKVDAIAQKNSSKRSELKQEIQFLRDEVLSIDLCNAEMSETIASILQSETIATFEGGKYKDDVRVCIYELLSLNVGVSNVAPIIRCVLKNIAHKSVSRLPSHGLTCQMILESLTIVQAQLGDQLSQSIGYNTLQTDGTTKFHEHYGT